MCASASSLEILDSGVVRGMQVWHPPGLQVQPGGQVLDAEGLRGRRWAARRIETIGKQQPVEITAQQIEKKSC